MIKILLRLLTALGLFLVVVTVLPVDALLLKIMSSPWSGGPGEVLIVLGADSNSDMIGLASYWRSVYAVRAWREGGFQKVVVSGGKTSGGAVIAEQMRDFLLSQGIPADRIQVEGGSHDTHENALYTAKLLQGVPGRKVLLTSDYHMWRASRVFRKVGLEVQTRPYPDVAKRMDSWKARWGVFLDLCIEVTKIGYYFCRGWI